MVFGVTIGAKYGSTDHVTLNPNMDPRNLTLVVHLDEYPISGVNEKLLGTVKAAYMVSKIHGVARVRPGDAEREEAEQNE